MKRHSAAAKREMICSVLGQLEEKCSASGQLEMEYFAGHAAVSAVVSGSGGNKVLRECLKSMFVVVLRSAAVPECKLVVLTAECQNWAAAPFGVFQFLEQKWLWQRWLPE